MIASAALVAPSTPALAEVATTLPETVSADPLPTAQIDGVVWAQAITGDTVWVGGEFSTARPAGAAPGIDTVPRANLMSYNLTTGEMTSWNPGANAKVRSIVASPDGSRIYVGGNFTTIGGATRYRVAAFDTATGALLSWAPYANAGVTDIAAHGDTVFLVGNFSTLSTGQRTRLGAVSATSGALLPLHATLAGGYGVSSVVVDPTGSKIVVAGSFTSANGSTDPGRGMAALDAVSGALRPWAVNSLIRNAGNNAGMTSLASDGDSVYGTGYDFGGGVEDDFEGTFRARWSDGELVWLEDCHGDNYSVAVSAGVVYTSSHDHFCGNVGGFPQSSPTLSFRHSLAFAKDYQGALATRDVSGYKSYAGSPAGTLLHWYPDWQVGTYTGKSQATWDVAANDDYVLYGGEFLKVNGIAQQGLVRFAKRSAAPGDSGPERSGTAFPVTATAIRAGEVTLTWTANTDRDDVRLTYRLQREDLGSAAIHTVETDSNFWTMPGMSYVDTSVVPGSAYRYRVVAVDPSGNEAVGAWASVAAAEGDLLSGYSASVLEDGAIHYWPLDEVSGTEAADLAGGGALKLSGATRDVAGANEATLSGATKFSGAAGSFGVTPANSVGMDTFTVEAWFSTTSTQGGKVVNFGNRATGNSSTHDRSVYLDGAGRITFGVSRSGYQTISSAPGFNDGQWHHVVATLSSAGMSFYVDGTLIDTRPSVTAAQAYTGFWRIGGDNRGGWPNVGASGYLDGAISDVAVYSAALSAAQVQNHHSLALPSTTDPTDPSEPTEPTAPTEPTEPADGLIARDLFDRVGADGWGAADQGGPWTLAGTPARFSVSGGSGAISLATPVTQQAILTEVSTTTAHIDATFSVDRIANAQYITVIGRQVGAEQYQLRVRVAADGTAQLNILRSGAAVGAGVAVPALTIVPGQTYRVVFEVTGTAPTSLSGKLWQADTAEPAAWQVTRTDATSALQAAGSVGVSSYVPTSANAFPLVLAFDDISVTTPAG